MADPPPPLVRKASLFKIAMMGGTDRDVIRSGERRGGWIERRGWVAALRSKLCELEHAGPAAEQESHEACP